MSTHRTVPKTCAALLGAAALLLGQAGTAQATTFSFALMGDQPYTDLLEPATDSLIKTINSDPDVQWILHIGDIKGGAEPCTDELLIRRIDQLRRSEKPLVYVPGDNEWTDCHRESNGNFKSRERLEFLRKQAFTQPATLGKTTFPVRQQTSHPYPEQLMWQHGSTLFVSLNVPGSNNDLENPKSRKTKKTEVQHLLEKRQNAINAWLSDAEKLFANAKATPTETVIAIQGNPIDGSGSPNNNGYNDFMKRLVKYIDNTGRPVLLVHGDTHRYKWDRPNLKQFGGSAATNALFYRAEGWGHPFVNAWVKVTVRPGASSPFNIKSIAETAKPDN
ncbi:metallophosphoesterase [Limnobacter sp.]|uniref:metallophosphoesterase n=1 Tax=Limnobacter sp. TaxID=2003368 RepID=UPI002FE3FFCB